MNTKIKTYSYSDESGVVLITALLILALLTIIGIGSILMTNTEVKISGNLKAASLSLYVAEGGLEVAKTIINSSSSNNFSISPGTTNKTLTGFTYSSPGCAAAGSTIKCRTITDPLSWFDTNWRGGVGGVCTATSSTLTTISDWPVCRVITVGNETTLVTVQKPTWSPATPTKIIFKSITSEHTSNAPNKKVSVNFEIDFGNNLLAFQEFRSNTVISNEMAQIDNVATPNDAILSSISRYEWAMGGTANTDRITGIYTGNMKIRIYYCSQATVGACAGNWNPLGIPQKNGANNTFLLLSTASVGPETPSTANTGCFYTLAPTLNLAVGLNGYHFKAAEILSTEPQTCT